MVDDNDWRTISCELAYPGRVVHLEIEELRAPDGSVHRMEVVRHRGATSVVAVDDEGQVFLVRQYRPAIGERILEIPAGKLEVGEEKASCALRELEEETGQVAGRIDSLGWIYTTPGFTTEKIWIFLARDLALGEQALEAGEDLEVVRLPLARALAMAARGEIVDSKTVTALFRAVSFLDSGDGAGDGATLLPRPLGH